MSDAEARCLARAWFYPFRLASGAVTPTYVADDVAKIHDTRAAMLDAAVRTHFPAGAAGRTAIDLACHEGWFAQQVAALGFDVLGVDARVSWIFATSSDTYVGVTAPDASRNG